MSDWPTAAGPKRATIVASGAAYKFDDVQASDNPYLTSSGAVNLAVSGGAFALVDTTTARGYSSCPG